MKSFLSGRPTAPVTSLKPIVDSIAARSFAAGGARPHGGGADHGHQPTVECVKRGDKVTHLVVTCACGERIEIDCLYAGPA